MPGSREQELPGRGRPIELCVEGGGSVFEIQCYQDRLVWCLPQVCQHTVRVWCEQCEATSLQGDICLAQCDQAAGQVEQ